MPRKQSSNRTFSLDTTLYLFRIVKSHFLILYIDHHHCRHHHHHHHHLNEDLCERTLRTQEVYKTLKDMPKKIPIQQERPFQNNNSALNESPERFYRLQKVESENQI